MNREAYLLELKERLSGLQEEEIADALNYCEEYFNEAENEEAAVADLGTPTKFAAQLKADSACRSETVKTSNHTPALLKRMMMIFMGICALPLALPFLLCAILLILTFIVLLAVLVSAAFIAVVILGYGSVASLISLLIHVRSLGDGMIHIGISLIFLGFALLGMLTLRYLMKRVFPLFVERIALFYQRQKGVLKHEN